MKNNNTKPPHYQSQYTCPWFVFYPEHMGIDPADDKCVDLMNDKINQIKAALIATKENMDMHAIVHYHDYVAGDDEDPLIPSIEKPHAHIAFRTNEKNRRPHLKFFTDLLGSLGIAYRFEDKNLLRHGKAIVNCDFNYVVVYHTHETPNAINDGKSLYDRSEVITTLSDEEIEEIHYKYQTGTIKPTKRSSRNDLLENYKAMAKIAAHSFSVTFNKWFSENIPAVDQSTARPICKTAWDIAFNEAVQDLPPFYARCSIFIHSRKAGLGKTMTTHDVLKAMDLCPLSIGSGAKTGKTDTYDPFTNKAIIFNDTTIPAPLDTFDSVVQPLYRRGSGNSPNLTRYIVVTTNKSFDDYFNGYDSYNIDQIAAIKSRLFICTCDEQGHLIVEHRPERFHGSQRQEVYEMFEKFFDLYNARRDEYLQTISGDEAFEMFEELAYSSIDTPIVEVKDTRTPRFVWVDKGCKVKRLDTLDGVYYQYKWLGQTFKVKENLVNLQLRVLSVVQEYVSYIPRDEFEYAFNAASDDDPGFPILYTETQIRAAFSKYVDREGNIRKVYKDSFEKYINDKKVKKFENCV